MFCFIVSSVKREKSWHTNIICWCWGKRTSPAYEIAGLSCYFSNMNYAQANLRLKFLPVDGNSRAISWAFFWDFRIFWPLFRKSGFWTTILSNFVLITCQHLHIRSFIGLMASKCFFKFFPWILYQHLIMRKLGFRTSRGRSTLLSDFLFECTKKKTKQNKQVFFILSFSKHLQW